MTYSRVFIALACALGLLEIGLCVQAHSAKRQADRMLEAADSFHVALTFRAEAQAAMERAGLKPVYEACSAPTGTSCDGFAVDVESIPTFGPSSFGRLVSYILGSLSLYKPMGVVGNFYFYADRLDSMKVQLGNPSATVGVNISSSSSGETAPPGWKHNFRDGSDTLAQVVDPLQPPIGLGSMGTFNVNCFVSIRGCDSRARLFTPAAQR